jgi:hypothetical protein
MARKRAVEHDDADVDLAPTVTPQQLAALSALGYRGPTPSTQPQAATLLRRLEEEQRRVGPRTP